MLRAGPFSDERIIRFINRRFVPCVFDLASGPLADADAKAFVVKRRPHLGRAAVSNEPLFVITPDGEIVEETIDYGNPHGILKILREVVKDFPEYAAPQPDEKTAATPLARARIRVELLDDEGADKLLADAKEPEAHLLSARIARRRRDWPAMEKHLAALTAASFAADVRMERAYRFWREREFARLSAHLKGFPEEGPRWVEARYFEGLALFHQGNKDEALRIWKKTITAAPEGPWVYRTDWAYTNVKAGPRRGTWSITSSDKPLSPLGRIEYMGSRNPDLAGPGHW